MLAIQQTYSIIYTNDIPINESAGHLGIWTPFSFFVVFA